MNVKLQLVLFSILTSLNSLSFAVDNVTWTYDINSDEVSVTFTDYPNDDCPKDVIIPSSIDGLSVTTIGYKAFVDSTLNLWIRVGDLRPGLAAGA